jgi:hypothetical protein
MMLKAEEREISPIIIFRIPINVSNLARFYLRIAIQTKAKAASTAAIDQYFCEHFFADFSTRHIGFRTEFLALL